MMRQLFPLFFTLTLGLQLLILTSVVVAPLSRPVVWALAFISVGCLVLFATWTGMQLKWRLEKKRQIDQEMKGMEKEQPPFCESGG